VEGGEALEAQAETPYTSLLFCNVSTMVFFRLFSVCPAMREQTSQGVAHRGIRDVCECPWAWPNRAPPSPTQQSLYERLYALREFAEQAKQQPGLIALASITRKTKRSRKLPDPYPRILQMLRSIMDGNMDTVRSAGMIWMHIRAVAMTKDRQG
jgi:hypothetical protein